MSDYLHEALNALVITASEKAPAAVRVMPTGLDAVSTAFLPSGDARCHGSFSVLPSRFGLFTVHG